MKRGIFAIVVAVTLVAGCARPGGPGAAAPSPRAPDAETSSPQAPVRPSVVLATCVQTDAAPVTVASARPRTTGPVQGPGDQFQRNYEANKAFRDRKPLSETVAGTNASCAHAVEAGLIGLRAEGRYDAESITSVLTSAGLRNAAARKAGRLDLAGSGGLLFAGWTGQACVFGEHGPDRTEVNLGSMIADGGCLPAPD